MQYAVLYMKIVSIHPKLKYDVGIKQRLDDTAWFSTHSVLEGMKNNNPTFSVSALSTTKDYHWNMNKK